MGVGPTVVGTRLFGDSLVAQVQSGVEHDLNTAFLVYNDPPQRHTRRRSSSSPGSRTSSPRFVEGRRWNLSAHLARRREMAGLDMLTVTDADGIVVSRATPARAHGDDQSSDQVVGHVLSNRGSISGSMVVPGDVLELDAPELAARARMPILETPRARPSDLGVLSDGMALKAAAPIMANGTLIGVLYGGVLLNGSEDIVDRVKETAYAGETWQGKDIGTATIFQDDVRISTNVMSQQRRAAPSARACPRRSTTGSSVTGGRWIASAFVVDDWYITAYGPIHDLEEQVIGILYVGVLAGKFDAMRDEDGLDFRSRRASQAWWSPSSSRAFCRRASSGRFVTWRGRHRISPTDESTRAWRWIRRPPTSSWN